jgi:hypothetical protein
MGETPYRSASVRYRRARGGRRNERGVVAVIGTLLALLVFFTLFGVFITQYLPLWMTQDEAAFTSQADFAFASFKSAVDSQYQFGLPQTVGVPFPLASASVPLLAQPTQATLEFLPSGCARGFVVPPASGTPGQPVNSSACIFTNVSVSQGPGGSGFFSQRIASGVLEMVLPNRYYSQETFYYEDDAVIQAQPGGYQVMNVNPPLNISRTATGNTTVTTTMLQLYGNASAIVGQGSQPIYSHFRYSQSVATSGAQSSTNHSFLPFTFRFQVGTEFPCAWSTFLQQTIATSGVGSRNVTLAFTPSTFSPTPADCANPGGATTVVTLTVTNVNYVQYYYAGVQLSSGVGGT